MPRIYLSYGMEKADLTATKIWADYMVKHLVTLGYDVFNPLDGEHNRLAKFGIKSIEEFHSLRAKDLKKYLEIMTFLRKTDTNELLDSDSIIVKLDKELVGGSGTSGELTLGCVFGLSIYGILTEKDLPVIPAWLLSCVSYDNLFTNQDACIEEIKRNPIKVIPSNEYNR